MEVLLKIDRLAEHLVDIILPEDIVWRLSISGQGTLPRRRCSAPVGRLASEKATLASSSSAIQFSSSCFVIDKVVVQLEDEMTEQGLLLLLREILKFDRQVDAGLDGDVKRPDTIRGQDQNALVIF